MTATGHDALVLGPAATPTIGWLVRESGLAGGIQISASHNPPEYNGLKFFQRGGMVLGAEQGRALLDRWQRQGFRLGTLGWPRPGRSARRSRFGPPRPAARDRGRRRDPRAASSRWFSTRAMGREAGWGRGSLRPSGPIPSCSARSPTGGMTIPRSRPRRTSELQRRSCRRSVPPIGFAQDPDADRLAVVDETGRYIGEELTLALAALRRLEQARGPLVFNLSTSMTAEKLAIGRDCPVHRTPVGEINVVERMIAEKALLGGEGNGGVIDPRVGYVRDSFVAWR